MNPRSLVKKIVPVKLFKKIEPLGHLIEAVLVQTYYGFPARKLKVVGVTGTDGKTSTSSFIAQLLRTNGSKVAMMTTISLDLGDGRGEQPNPSRLTTVGSLQLAKLLKVVKKSGVEWLVLETTSQALAQHRVLGVPYSVAVMTNIDHEHLDYHGTFENYRAAKLRLFKQCNRNRRGLRIGVLNADDPSANLFGSAIKNPLSYGVRGGDIQASNIKTGTDGVSYDVKIAGKTHHIKTSLAGSFNVYNTLAAVAVGQAIGLSGDVIEQGITAVKSVEGRMTIVPSSQPFQVIVDYAHTPESFEKLFKDVKPSVKGRLICVFGSAGRRDESKRARQGEIAGKLTDIVVVTEEDDRDIDGQEILKEIASGAERAGKVSEKDLFLVHDREKAVEFAIKMAKPGDVVMLLGKGHEKSILSSGPMAEQLRNLPQDDTDPRRVVKRDYDEVTVAREVLAKLMG